MIKLIAEKMYEGKGINFSFYTWQINLILQLYTSNAIFPKFFLIFLDFPFNSLSDKKTYDSKQLFSLGTNQSRNKLEYCSIAFFLILVSA